VALLLAAALGGCEKHRQPPPANILGTYAKNCSIPPANWRKPPANPGDRMWAIIRLDASGHTRGTPNRPAAISCESISISSKDPPPRWHSCPRQTQNAPTSKRRAWWC